MTVHTGTPVQQITVDSSHATASSCRTATKHEADAVVAAVPSSMFKKMAPPLTPDYVRGASTRRWQFALCMVLTMKRPLSPIYWMNIPDRSMPFLALVEHTNFIGPENYGGKHILYISNYLQQDHEYFDLSDDAALGDLRAGAEADQPGVLVGLDEPALAVQGAVRAADHPTRIQRQQARPPHAGRRPVPGEMTQIYPEDRGQNYSIRMGEEVAQMVIDDHAKRADAAPNATPDAVV